MSKEINTRITKELLDLVHVAAGCAAFRVDISGVQNLCEQIRTECGIVREELEDMVAMISDIAAAKYLKKVLGYVATTAAEIYENSTREEYLEAYMKEYLRPAAELELTYDIPKVDDLNEETARYINWNNLAYHSPMLVMPVMCAVHEINSIAGSFADEIEHDYVEHTKFMVAMIENAIWSGVIKFADGEDGLGFYMENEKGRTSNYYIMGVEEGDELYGLKAADVHTVVMGVLADYIADTIDFIEESLGEEFIDVFNEYLGIEDLCDDCKHFGNCENCERSDEF